MNNENMNNENDDNENNKPIFSLILPHDEETEMVYCPCIKSQKIKINKKKNKKLKIKN